MKDDGSFVQTKDAVWTKKGDHGDHWQFGQVYYPGGNQSIYNFIIEGYATYYQTGDIALGKLQIFNYEDLNKIKNSLF